MTSNFEFLSDYWEDLAELGKTAESYLYSDPMFFAVSLCRLSTNCGLGNPHIGLLHIILHGL